MKHSAALIWSLAALASAAALMPAVAAGSSARAHARAAQSELATVSEQASELTRLQLNTPTWISRERPESVLAPRVTAVLAQAGLAASTLQNLSGDSAAPLVAGGAQTPGSAKPVPVVRRRATFMLVGVTLPQLGKFLAGWRQAVPVWQVVSIDLSPDGGAPKATRDAVTAGGDLPLRCTLGLEAAYLDQPAQETPTQPAREAVTPRQRPATPPKPSGRPAPVRGASP